MADALSEDEIGGFFFISGNTFQAVMQLSSAEKSRRGKTTPQVSFVCMLCCCIVCCAVVCCIVVLLYCVVLLCVVLYCTVACCAVYCTVFCCVVLYLIPYMP